MGHIAHLSNISYFQHRYDYTDWLSEKKNQKSSFE